MSRSINISASAEDVITMCQKHAASISAMEDLPDGGTRVVLMRADDVETIRRAFRKSLLPDKVRRTPLWTKPQL